MPKQSVLFVDDESHFLSSLQRILRKYKNTWNLYFVESADLALEKIEEHNIDTVVSDVQMPGKSGFDLLKIIKSEAHTAHIPVIILTGNSETDLKRNALDMGATDLLNKPINAEDLVARLTNVLLLKSTQDQLAEQNRTLEEKVRERTAALEYLHRDSIWRLAKAGEMRDEETGDHVVRIGHFSRVLAKHYGLDSEEVETIFLTAPLHDIGKIAIPDAVLLKPSGLTKEEWKIMHGHCAAGAAILLSESKGKKAYVSYDDADLALQQSNNDILKTAASIALNHHEHWDGSGYPNQITKEEIPIAGRIVAIADVYDALRSHRVYREAFSVEKTIEVITENSGSHFDPDLIEVFTSVSDQFEEIRWMYNE